MKANDFILHKQEGEEIDSIMIMHKEGLAFARIYWYHDDRDSLYVESLNVSAQHRRKGLGTQLMSLIEEIGSNMNVQFTYLVVIGGKGSGWLYEWYTRSEYYEYTEHDEIEDAVWMRKQLLNF